MPKTVDVNEVEARFEALLAEVEAGEKFLICRDGRPIIRLIPFDTAPPCVAPPEAIHLRK